MRSNDSDSSWVPVHLEPMHHLVYDGPLFRILDVEIPPGETTSYHEHDAAITFVTIDGSTVRAQVLGEDWPTAEEAHSGWRRGDVSWNLDYASASLVHRVQNSGTTPFRLIAIINYGPGSSPEKSCVDRMSGDVQAQCPWFSYSRLSLREGESRAIKSPGARSMVAVLVEGGAQIEEAANPIKLSAPGDFAVLEESFLVRSPASDQTTIVIVGIR